MSIAHLPPDTARAVRSTSAISDPCSLVKELIDNSLDAGATYISVEVSANTLDTIHVKDNGVGIHPNDRHLVCKRSCTSKLQTIDDLKNIGGSTLGFRGEALASAAEMCGSIAITTKVAGEMVGETLKYDRTGLLVSCTKAAHPTGTAVRISEFLKLVPVRKQIALKSAPKTLNQMKKVLNAYVLSRPEIRLSFKILKTKSDSSWVYASTENATVSTAMLRVVGAEAISQCTTITWPQIQGGDDDFLLESLDINESNPSAIRIVATIPKPGSDLSKINHAGQYVSIDGRPMSISNGVGKELVKLFKSYLRSGSHCVGSQTSLVNPFLFMHLHCQPGSYDVNVEPSKNDVVFEDSKLVMSTAENLFKTVYGEIESKHTHQNNRQLEDQGLSPQVIRSPRSRSASSRRTHEAEDQPLFLHIPSHAVKHCHSIGNALVSSTQGKKDNVSVASSADTTSCPQLAENNPTLSDSSRLTNPWMLAKRQYVTPPKKNAQSRNFNSHLLTPAYEDESFRSDSTMVDNCTTNSLPASPANLTPIPMQTPETRLAKAGHNISPTGVSKSQMNALSSLSEPSVSHGGTQRVLGGSGSLDVWIRNPRDAANHPADEGQDIGIPRDREDCENRLPEIAIARRFGKEGNGVSTGRSHAYSPAGLSPRALLSSPGIHRNSTLSNTRGYRPPSISFEVDDDQNYRIRESTDNQNSTPEGVIGEALDFEYRKKAATRLYRQLQQQQEQHQMPAQPMLLSWAGANHVKTSQSSPHQNRYSKAKADLVSHSPRPKLLSHEMAFLVPEMDSEDPREYFRRHKDDLSHHASTHIGVKNKRILTNQLPLEVIPNAFALHGLALNWSRKDDVASILGNELFKADEYIRKGIVPPSPAFLEVQPTDISLWTTRLSTLTQKQYRSEHVGGEVGTKLVFDTVPMSHASAP
ncbi:hypothetical protein RJZ56_003350 [Blastomyces dermatitidis]|uniref:DNA mismatch repair protein n=1 Tax=Ajellomyces dermatitidis (strain ER-3 / ATCC MYA-2586) TaxID=559297 RepID=A0ABP2F050_AJEDR|nr:DNA mismatch repair protein [Blastomyces dermatitidis ER-3]EEQ88053.2 DNA mismatch repair protein [Blastomyces dermatitidis ER-3]